LVGRQHPFHLRNLAHENPVIQVPPVEGPTWWQGFHGCLDACVEGKGPRGSPCCTPGLTI